MNKMLVGTAVICLMWVHIVMASLSHALPESIDLSSLIQRTWKNSPKIKRLESILNSKKALMDQASATFFPIIELNADTGYESTHIVDTETQLNRHRVALFVKENLFRGGKDLNDLKQKKLDLQSIQLELLSEKQAISLSLVTDYFNLFRFHRLIADAKDNVKQHKVILHHINQKYQAHLVKKSDQLLAMARLAEAEAIEVEMKRKLHETQVNFYKTAGFYPPKHLVKVSRYKGKLILPKNLDAILKEVLHKNPHRHAIDYTIQAKKKALLATQADIWPSLSLELSSDIGNNVNGIEGKSDLHKAVLVLNYPLFRGGADISKMKVAMAKWQEVKANQQLNDRELVEQSTKRWFMIHDIDAEIKKFKQFKQGSKDLVKEYQLQFSVGRCNLFNVLDAQREFFQAKQALTQLSYDRSLITYQLFVLMGRNLLDILQGVDA